MTQKTAPSSTASSFVGPPSERRYSVRFLNSLEGRLRGLGVSAALASQLHHRFSTLGRAGIDHEGRLLDAWLSSANPLPSVLLYAQLASLQSAVTPGGFRVGPNPLGTWTVTPRDGDAFELVDGQTRQLTDGAVLRVTGTRLAVSGAVEAQVDQVWSEAVAEFTRITQLAVMAFFSEARVPVPAALSALARAAAPAGQARGLPGLLTAGGLPASPGEHPLFFQLNSGWVASLALVLGALNVVCSPAAPAVLTLLRTAGHSVAPSRRADPELERAVLVKELALRSAALLEPVTAAEAMSQLKAFAASLRGDPRERLQALMGQTG